MSAVAQRQADKRSLGFQFKQQLMELVKLIESGKAHYVRCAPPPHTHKPQRRHSPPRQRRRHALATCAAQGPPRPARGASP